MMLFNRYPVVYPKLSDARYIQILSHCIIAFFGQLAYDFAITPGQVLFVVLGCAALDMLWNFALKRIILFPASGLIGGLGLAMLLRFTPDSNGYLLYGLAGFLAISSKYMFALKTEGGKNHIFNPSNFGIVAMLLLFPHTALVRPDQWDASVTLLLVTLLLGVTLVVRAKVAWMTLVFIITETVLYFIRRGGLEGANALWLLNAATVFWTQTPILLIFAFHMLSDPRTAPKTQMGRTLFAVVIALLHWLLLAFGLGRSAIFFATAFFSIVKALFAVAAKRNLFGLKALMPA